MRVSIITVCYNSAKTIEQTIKSVLGQSYPDIEYIIIDGGSKDGTLDIIRRYESRISFWSSEPDHGIYDAMNKGIQRATGEVIGLINSDDWYCDGAISAVVDYFSSHNVQWLHGDIIHIDDTGKQTLVKGLRNPGKQLWYDHPTVFVKKVVYERYGTFNLRYRILADGDFMLRLFENQVSVGYIPQPLAGFRLGGVSNTKHWRGYRDFRAIIQAHKGQRALFWLELFRNPEHSLQQHERSLIRKYLQTRIHRGKYDAYFQGVLSKYHKSSIVLWGAGLIGKQMIMDCKGNQWPIKAIIDKSFDKQKTGIMGVPVYPPEWIVGRDVLLILTVGKMLLPEVEFAAEKLGYHYGKNCLSYSDFQEKVNCLYVGEQLRFIRMASGHEWARN